MPSGQHYHDEAERKKWQNPEKILKNLGLGKGQTFIDIGCGEGFFSIAAARIVGDKGKIFGIDLNQDAIANLRKRARKEGIDNATFKVGKAENTHICKSCADFVFFGIDLHDFEDPKKVLINAKGMLKPTGKIVDLDWKKKPMLLGPPVKIRFSEEYAKKLIESAGFAVEKIEDSGDMHYLIIAGIKS